MALRPSTWSFMSEMSGDTTTARPGRDQRRGLEAQRLAAAGRHHEQRVAAREDRVHHLALVRPELRVAPVPREDVFEGGGRSEGGTHASTIVSVSGTGNRQPATGHRALGTGHRRHRVRRAARLRPAVPAGRQHRAAASDVCQTRQQPGVRVHCRHHQPCGRRTTSMQINPYVIFEGPVSRGLHDLREVPRRHSAADDLRRCAAGEAARRSRPTTSCTRGSRRTARC